MFCLFSGVSAAVRAWKHRELTRRPTQRKRPAPLTPALSPVGRGRPLVSAATAFPLGDGRNRPPSLPSGEKVPEGRMRGALEPRNTGRPPLTAVSPDARTSRESIVAARFDALHARFKPEVADDDPRVLGIVASLGPLTGRRVLDLGCGKGRFARVLAARGARVVGLDVSAAMLAGAGRAGLDRVLGSARRLPFGGSSFDAAIAVEVFEHLEPRVIDDACREVTRVLRPGGLFVLVDKNVYAMNVRRPWLPALAIKWLDQRRGRWMYPHGGPVRERWFRPAGMRRRLLRWFREVRVIHLLSGDEAGRFPFRMFPSTRLFVLWGGPGAGRCRANGRYTPIPASLPLLLWKTPPGLELILAQEGVPFEVVREAHPLIFRGGRFILFDGRTTPRAALSAMLSPEHVAIDVDTLRREEPCDPFEALIDTRGARASWTVGFRKLTERVARHARGPIRRRLIDRLRRAVAAAGGVWIRLSPFPYPYRSAFSFRADLDEPLPDDYFRFAAARTPLADCCTHFVSTHAYAQHPSVLRDLKECDTQSHGHFHHVYRDPEANRVNLERAHRILGSFGIDPTGFAAARPMGASASMMPWKTSATCTRPTSSSATTISRSSPGRVTGFPACSRSPCIRSARVYSWRPACRTSPAGRSASTSRTSWPRDWPPASWPSPTDTPSVGWAGCPRSCRRSPGRSNRARWSGG